MFQLFDELVGGGFAFVVVDEDLGARGAESLGDRPAMLRIMMQPGDVIPRHYHAAQAETLYILEGELIDEGTPYSAGTELNVKPKIHHGPHTTKTGVTFLAMYTGKVDLTDFKLSKGAE